MVQRRAGLWLDASFLSDGDPVGFAGDRQHEQFRKNMTTFSNAIVKSRSDTLGVADVRKAIGRMFDDYFGE
jgi:hypothetical protein